MTENTTTTKSPSSLSSSSSSLTDRNIDSNHQPHITITPTTTTNTTTTTTKTKTKTNPSPSPPPDSFKLSRPPSIGINFQNASVLTEEPLISDSISSASSSSSSSSSSRYHFHNHLLIPGGGGGGGGGTTTTTANAATAPATANNTTATTHSLTGGLHSDSSHASNSSSINGGSSLFSSNERHYILLPYQNDPILHFALDIGGTLIKMVYFQPTLTQTPTTPTTPDSSLYMLHSSSSSSSASNNVGAHFGPSTGNINGGDLTHFHYDDSSLSRQLPPVTVSTKAPSVPVQQLGGRLCFAKFETENIDNCIAFIKSMGNRLAQPLTIDATGGGAYKFEGKFKEELGLELRKFDEMQSVITGLNFLLRNLPNESFSYTLKQQRKNYETVDVESMFPYLLVNIGSGVSIVRVDGENKFERVSGSSLGGGTFWGLCRLLTNSDSFDEVLEMCLSGDNSKADMLVGDIYGTSYASVGLSADTIASSMGKPVRKGLSKESIAPGDIAKSLLFMISNNIGQIAYLNAIRYGLKRIYFGGFFIRDHPITMGCISYAINYWSKGEMKAFFLQHEGYLGALGAFFFSERMRSVGIPNDQSTDAPTKPT